MKQRKLLPLAALVMGLACQIGRWTLYRTAVDATGLLTAGTPLEWGSYALSVLAIGLFAAAAGKLGETEVSSEPILAALGQLIGGLGLGWTALRYPGEMPGLFGIAWKILGIAASICLLWSALQTVQKKTPQFLALLAPCLFWLVHLIDNYRGWSGQPQLQSYLFALLATISMVLFTYHTAGETVDMGKPRMRCFSALSAGFLCLAAILGPDKTQPLWLSCAIWAVTSLYAPKNPKKTE